MSPTRTALLLLALLAAGACQRAPAPEPRNSAMRPPPRAAAVRSGSSPVLDFVARARAGERATVSDAAFGGKVVVQLDRKYRSASNRDCRRFVVSPAGAPAGQKTRFACFAAGGLELIDF